MTRKDDKIDKVLEFAARMDERHTALAKNVDELKEQVTKGFHDVGARVTKLESWKSKVIGYATAAATGLSVTANYLIEAIKKG